MIDVEAILNLLELKELIPEPDQPEECIVTKGRIEFKNVSFTYD